MPVTKVILRRGILRSSVPRADQHALIGAWIARARTPKAIMAMPPSLWRKLELASVLMNIAGDLPQPPLTAA